MNLDSGLMGTVCASTQNKDYSCAVSRVVLTHSRLTCSEQALTFVPELNGICAFLTKVMLTSFTTVPVAILFFIVCYLLQPKFLNLMLFCFPKRALKM